MLYYFILFTNSNAADGIAGLQLEVDALGLAQLQRRLKDKIRKDYNQQRNKSMIFSILLVN
jgi:hypothetical protein